VADATVSELGDYFVGERVRVWVSAGRRKTYAVPMNLIVTRSGIDYVRLWLKDGPVLDVPVQRGQLLHSPHASGRIEILSGLAQGDRLLKP